MGSHTSIAELERGAVEDMSPDSMESFRLLLANQAEIKDDITEIRVSLGKLETQMSTLCTQRIEQHDDHLLCRKNIDIDLKRLDEVMENMSDRVERLFTWIKAIGIAGSIALVILTILNILLAIGIKV
jgi:hypothetical protein